MFINYKKLVLENYIEKRKNQKISQNLLHPTPAKLRDECLIVFQENYKPEDENMLRVFFMSKKNDTDFYTTIKNFDVDKFKPLVNFLKSKTNTTDDKNIELLAWLINFSPRPYRFSEDYNPKNKTEDDIEDSQTEKDQSDSTDNNASDQPIIIEDKPKEPTIEISKPEEKISSENVRISSFQQHEKGLFSNFNLAFFGIVIVLSSFIFYQIITNSTHNSKANIPINDANVLIVNNGNSTKNQGQKLEKSSQETLTKPIAFISNNNSEKMLCMVWEEDHYQPISCDSSTPEGYHRLDYDEDLVREFKKVNSFDTITKKSIGKIWYAKNENKVEFFTSRGVHPKTQRELKPITKYIIEKYVDNDTR